MRETRDSHCPTCGLVFRGYDFAVGVQCDLAHRHPGMWPNGPALEKLREEARKAMDDEKAREAMEADKKAEVAT